METQGVPPRPWYKKKRYIAILALTGLIVLFSGDSNTSSNQSQNNISSSAVSSITKEEVAPIQRVAVPTKSTSSSSIINSDLSNDNYYTNTYGNKVHSPAYSEAISVGASAQCRDGTYSFSQSRRGTCSHHGGVAEWL